MHPDLPKRLRSLSLICLLTSFAGVIFQMINEQQVNVNSILFGFPLGIAFSMLELFVFPRFKGHINQWSFTRILIVKSVFYTSTIYLVIMFVIVVSGAFTGHKLNELATVLASRGQLILVIYTLVVYTLLIFLLQVDNLLGDGVLWKFIRGKYHVPREEERIFMFLDMNSSTTIAEKLGHIQFYKLLNEVFHEISDPVLETKAEIYQYVGDEVVLTWKMEHGLQNSNCVKTFLMFKQNLLRHSENYRRKFGVQPEFKAALHFGKVVCAQIGDLKRQIVYNGDVLNTTSRIQSECKTYGRDVLVSGDLVERLHNQNGYTWERIDSVALRGKLTEIEIFSMAEVV
jgi:adenylate cyclase